MPPSELNACEGSLALVIGAKCHILLQMCAVLPHEMLTVAPPSSDGFVMARSGAMNGGLLTFTHKIFTRSDVQLGTSPTTRQDEI